MLDHKKIDAASLILQRASLLEELRGFFASKNVLEVQVPVLSSHTVTDPEVNSIGVPGYGYLQTSPEYLMKRLLSSGSPSIYSIGPAFRDQEVGRHHRSEFVMIEWYRIGLDDLQLIDEIKELLNVVLGFADYQEISYQEVLESHSEKDLDEDLRFSLASQELNPGRFIIKDYPADKAVLARLDEDNKDIARRFEFVVDGLELANGYFELKDWSKHMERFATDNLVREARELPTIDIDEKFMTSIRAGLPDCAGVALGFDRLLMLKMGESDIGAVQLF